MPLSFAVAQKQRCVTAAALPANNVFLAVCLQALADTHSATLRHMDKWKVFTICLVTLNDPGRLAGCSPLFEVLQSQDSLGNLHKTDTHSIPHLSRTVGTPSFLLSSSGLGT